MTEHRPGNGEKVVDRVGRLGALAQQDILLLREIVAWMSHETLDELAAELDHLGDVCVRTATIRRTLRAQGIVRSMPVRQGGGKSVESMAPVAALKRYGYTATHRREAGQYSTDLTDAEWSLVANLSERPEGSRGAPVRYERRNLVDDCCYVLRTGCAWRLLPSSFALWQAVYKAFIRWFEVDAFEHMQDRLRLEWRARMGRGVEPSAAVIDAQSNSHRYI